MNNNYDLPQSPHPLQSQCLCFIVPPHIEVKCKTRDINNNLEEVCQELRRRRIGSRTLHRSILQAPKAIIDGIDDQDIFTASNRMQLPGRKVANVTSDITSVDEDSGIDEDTIQCWKHTQSIIEFYRDILGINLKTELNGQVTSTIKFGKDFNNAFFNGDQMTYGEGDGVYFEKFCHDASVICHELGHAVVDNTVSLVYEGQSGALNESYADVFAICYQHYVLQKSFDKLSKKDWMIGEIAVVGDGALRSFTSTSARPMHHPLGADSEPRHMRHFYRGTEDDGGVHINSSIINHAFYKVCKRLSEISKYKKSLKTWEMPLELWFSLLKETIIPTNCTFKTFASALIKKANVKYGKQIGLIVRNGLNDVGLVVLRRIKRVKPIMQNENQPHDMDINVITPTTPITPITIG
jgi:Zn-dependent metalloprotease